MFRVEKLNRFGIVKHFIVQADKIGFRFSRVPSAQAIDFFEMRRCDLSDVFADFDLRFNGSVFPFDRCEFVYRAEYRVAFSP